MDIYIDCPKYIDYPKDKNQFYISVPIGDGQKAISFDWTSKSHRIILQRYKEERNAPEGKPSGEWDTIYISDGKFMGKEHIVWYDHGKEDWVNGKVWETIQEWPFQMKSAESLINRVNIICDNLEKIEEHKENVKGLEKELRSLIEFLRIQK